MPLDQIDVDRHDDKNMTFIEHLEELRWHLVRSVIVIILLAVVTFIFGRVLADRVVFGILDPDFLTYKALCKLGHLVRGSDILCIQPAEVTLQSLGVFEQFLFHIKLSLLSGVVLGFPYILFEFWRFLRPALKPTEQKKTTGIVLTSSLLFFAGVLFGYFVIAPLAFNFGANYILTDKLQNNFKFQSYNSLITNITLATGIIFELPIVIFFLAKMGLVTSALLKKNRKISVVLALALSAILTPPDVMSQILLTVPLYFLYEISIVVASRIEKQRAKEEELEET